MENMFGEYHNILVPVDGSEQSKVSFHKGLEIAKRNHAVLHLIFIDDDRNVTLSRDFTPVSNMPDTPIKAPFIDEFMKIGQEAGIEMEKTVTKGNPLADIATTFPKKFGTDLIVIAATGKGAVTRALVGSVSNYVVQHAHCDVLIVRD